MTECVVAYVPVLHEGYRRFFASHAAGRELYLIGPELYVDFRPLARDIRALDAQLVARAIAALDIASEVSVLDAQGATRLAERQPRITLPDEDVSHRVVEQFFSDCAVVFDSVFLRWDKTRTVQMLRPRSVATANWDALVEDLSRAAEGAALDSVDWWRQVGAAIELSDGTVRAASNAHHPHPWSPYVVGDPRSNFTKGVAYELSTATHAEARLIAEAARDGRATAGAVLYVTDFPCPPCAKLIAAAGIARVVFREGYAVLDGQDVLEAAGVEIVRAA